MKNITLKQASNPVKTVRRKKTEATGVKLSTLNFPMDGKELLNMIHYTNSPMTAHRQKWQGLEELGINEYDIAYTVKTDIFPDNHITLWKIKNYGFGVGYAFENFGDISIRVGDEVDTFKKRDCDFLGVVVGVMKPFNAPDIYAKKTDDFDADTGDEITVTCSACKATLTGRRDFIIAQGWKLNRLSTLCMTCRW